MKTVKVGSGPNSKSGYARLIVHVCCLDSGTNGILFYLYHRNGHENVKKEKCIKSGSANARLMKNNSESELGFTFSPSAQKQIQNVLQFVMK